MEYVLRGAGAEPAMDMIEHAARYLAGPGFPGFLAWVDQQYGGAEGGCPECGGRHGTSAEAIRINLGNLRALIENARH